MLISLMLAGCGFHLRGSVEFESDLKSLAVHDAEQATQFVAELRRALLAQGIEVTDTAPLALQVHGESFGKRVISVDSQGRAQAYDLSYGVNFSLYDADNVAWISHETITVHRDLQFDPNAVLGSNSEEERLREDIRRDAVNRLLRRLQSARPPGPST